MDLTDPTGLALEIAEVLGGEGVEHALYGGLLLAAYGEARETKDADLAVVRADAPQAATALERRLGLRCTPAFDRRPFGGLRIGRVTLIEGDELNTLDLVEPADPAYAVRALGRSLSSTLRERRIRVLSPEDFVVFKILSSRELDLRDAASVVWGLGAELDVAQVEREVERLEEALRFHPVRARWDRIREQA